MSQDLLHSAEVKELVRDAYRHVPPTTAAVARRLYSAEELAGLTLQAITHPDDLDLALEPSQSLCRAAQLAVQDLDGCVTMRATASTVDGTKPTIGDDGFDDHFAQSSAEEWVRVAHRGIR